MVESLPGIKCSALAPLFELSTFDGIACTFACSYPTVAEAALLVTAVAGNRKGYSSNNPCLIFCVNVLPTYISRPSRALLHQRLVATKWNKLLLFAVSRADTFSTIISPTATLAWRNNHCTLGQCLPLAPTKRIRK